MATEAVVLNLSDSPLWAPYKALHQTVSNAIVARDVDAIPDLETALKAHKPNFICLLKNPVRSQIHREAVKKAPTTGIAIAYQPGMKTLSQQLVDETIIVSDMFDLNELTSLELLFAGEQHQSHFPGLTRGLVATLLYYDGRFCIVSSLKALVHAREGKNWTLGLSPQLSSVIMMFTNQLLEEGLIMNVIGIIENFDIAKEFELLQKNRALGGPRYRKQVTDLIVDTKQTLAEIVFCCACQGTLTEEEVTRIMIYLSKQSCIQSDGTLDNTSIILLMALLYVMDVSCLQTSEERDPSVLKLNLVCHPHLISSIHKELCSGRVWQMEELKYILLFAWGVTLRTLFQFPLSNFTNICHDLEDGERMIDLALENGALVAMNTLIVKSSLFHEEEFFIKRFHTLITDLIVLMPVKIKDMRNRGDEVAKIISANLHQGLGTPTHLPIHFRHFLLLISEVYNTNNPLGLDMAAEYWCPMESFTHSTFMQHPAQRQISLFKFVRLAGDLLPAPLFVPYHRMLRSLSSSQMGAHQCFNYLKMNGKNVTGSHGSIVSWDHFFSTLQIYYNNLREELGVAPDARYIYRQRVLTKGITPQEVEGLNAVLKLISQVVKLDPIARVTLADNQEYAMIPVLLGLMSCSIPPLLKASILECLASFAASSEIAFNIWHGLECSQIIPTMQTTSVYYPSGILMEIEEVETRNEEYQVTIATLELLRALLDFPYHTLGMGQRVPGMQPYIDFVRDKILLKFNSKSYKSHDEKWQIVSLCLEIMVKVLRSYDVSIEEDVSNKSSLYASKTTSTSGSSHPGFNIMSEILQDSGLLRIILFILDDGMRILETYSPYPGQKNLEKGTLFALTALYETLSKQSMFLKKVRDSNSNLDVTPLDKLLKFINPRTGQGDHLCIISKYITFNTILPDHSCLSIEILLSLCESRQIAQHLISVFEMDSKESEVLMNAFVECLEVHITAEDTKDDNVEKDSSVDPRTKTRQNLLKLMLHCLKFPSPNVAHYLLGFNVHQPVAQTQIQDPGVMGSTRTCLHAVLSLLYTSNNSLTGPIHMNKCPLSLSLAYQLIYMLCSNQDTSGPTLRYLRSTHDFFYRHLQYLPFKSKEKYDVKLLLQQSWLMKAIAIELRVTALHNQRSHVERLLRSFLDDKPPSGLLPMEGVTEPLSGMSTMASFSFIQTNPGPMRRKLMCILDSLDFQEMPLRNSHQEWEFFGNEGLEKLFHECKVKDTRGIELINVALVNKKLNEEIILLQNDTRFSAIREEVRKVLEYVVSVNQSLLEISAKVESFESWRQVTEVLLLTSPLDVLGSEKKSWMVLEMSQELLRRVTAPGFLPELMPAASSVILTLTTTLRHSIFTKSSIGDFRNSSSSTVPKTVVTSLFSSLLIVFKAVLECLLQKGCRLQRVRANFYTAFLNLLCIVQKPYEEDKNSQILHLENQNLRREYVAAISSYGENIMNVVCRDVCTSHDVIKMLATSALDVIISIDSEQHWLSFMVSKGYLNHMLTSLVKDDEELQNLLTRSSNSYRIHYIFESKMALLCRIGSTSVGALTLLRNGAIGKLAECHVLHLRPDLYVPPDMKVECRNWNFPDLLKCYRQILQSMMKLILSIMMSLGSQHREANIQLLVYISLNLEFLMDLLKDRSILQTPEGLRELSLVTAVLSRAALDDADVIAGDTILIESRSRLLHLRQQLFSLLPYLLSPEVSVRSTQDSVASSQMKLSRLEIVAHVLKLCCGSINSSATVTKNHKILFAPSLSESPTMLGPQGLVRHIAPNKAPELGLIISLLYQCSSQFPNAIDQRKSLTLRLESLNTFSGEELQEYLSAEVKAEQMTVQHQRDVARKCLF